MRVVSSEVYLINFFKDHETEILYLYLFVCCMGFLTNGAFEDVHYTREIFGFNYVDSEASAWTMKYLFAPCFFVMLFLYNKELPNTKLKTFQRDVFCLFVLLLATFICSLSGFFQLANATLGEQTRVKICGEVIKYYKNTNSKNVPTSYEVTVREGGREHILRLTSSHFDSLLGNKKYCEEWTKGSLGFLYRWK